MIPNVRDTAGPWVFGPEPEPVECDHGVTFDETAADGLSAQEVRARWPRYSGDCLKGCGCSGIFYASYRHYLAGDW